MAQDTSYTPRNAWDVYTSDNERDQMHALAQRYVEFLSKCKTERETVAYVRERLEKAGFSNNFSSNAVVMPLREKCLFAARRGSLPLSKGVHLIAAHADTPRLDFKQRPLIEQAGIGQAKTHYYGGIRKYQWLARPLALHGTIIKDNGDVLRICLGEEADEPVFTIADLLPHLAQKQNTQTVADAFEGEKLNIVLGHTPKTASESDSKDKESSVKQHLLELLLKKYGISEEDFISAEMQAVPAGRARFVGIDESMIGAYGQDDRICVFTALESFLSVQSPLHTSVLMLWDKEEIGSDGATGASSRFLKYCIEDITAAWEPETRASHVMLATQALSADVNAALDPDYQEVHEKQNAALLGYGPCFCKFTGSRGKYGASEADAELLGALRGMCNAKNIPWQIAECGRVDQGGGGTVALFLAAYGMRVIDFGPAILSMHSPFELSSVADIFATVKAYTAFYEV